MRESGVTLLELLITVVIAVILVGVAIPSFLQMIQNNRVITYTNELVTALNLARSEAVKRNEQIMVSACNTSVDCNGTGSNWSVGWVVWVNANDSDNGGSPPIPTMDDGEQLRVFNSVRDNATITGPSNNVAFLATGASGSTVRECFGLAIPDATTFRRVRVALSGGVVVDSDVSCP